MLTARLKIKSHKLSHGGKGKEIRAHAQTHSLVFMHGLGDTALKWVTRLGYLLGAVGGRDNVKVLIPEADEMVVEWSKEGVLEAGVPQQSWFNLMSLDDEEPVDLLGLHSARSRLERILAAEVAAGVPVENILLMGHSQGGAVIYDFLLHSEMRVGAALVISSWILGGKSINDFSGGANTATPITVLHGTHDDIVPFTWGELSCERLQTNHQITFIPIESTDHFSVLNSVCVRDWLASAFRP